MKRAFVDQLGAQNDIGQALMGKQEGDELKVKTPKGSRNFELKKLKTIHEQGE